MFAGHRKKRKTFVAAPADSPQAGSRPYRGQAEISSRQASNYGDEASYDSGSYERQTPIKSGLRHHYENGRYPRGGRFQYDQYRPNHSNYDDPAPARRFLSLFLTELFDEFDYLHSRMDEIEYRLDRVIRRQKRNLP